MCKVCKVQSKLSTSLLCLKIRNDDDVDDDDATRAEAHMKDVCTFGTFVAVGVKKQLDI